MTSSLTKTFATSLTMLALVSLTGCAHHPSRAQIGTGVGAVVGGIAGDALFGSTLGTIGGAAAGALIGNELGKNDDGGRGQRKHGGRAGHRY